MFGHIIGGAPNPDFRRGILTADLAIGDTVLHVDDTGDFDEDASTQTGQLMVGVELDSDGNIDTASVTVLPYSTCDEDNLTVTLLGPSPVAASAGDALYVYDPATGQPIVDYTVEVELDGADPTGDSLPVVLSFGLIDAIGDSTDLTGQAIEFEEDEDGELVATNVSGSSPSAGRVKGKALDSVTVVAPGDQTLRLTYRPIPETEHLRWNGAAQDFDDFTRDQWTVTIPDPDNVIEVGDVLTMQYLYTDPTKNPIECRQIVFPPTSVIVTHGDGVDPHPASEVVGSPDSVWTDGSDGSYATGTNGGVFAFDLMQSNIPNLVSMGIDPGTVTAAEVHCRVSSESGGDFFQPVVTDAPLFAAAAYAVTFGVFASDTNYTGDPGVAINRVNQMTIDPGSTLPNLLAALAATTPNLSFLSSGATPDVTVYEATLVLTVCKPTSEWT